MNTEARRIFLIACIAVGCVCFAIQAIHDTSASRRQSEIERLFAEVHTNGSNLDRLRASSAERELVLQAERALGQSIAALDRTMSRSQHVPEWLRLSTAIGSFAIFWYLVIALRKKWDARRRSKADGADRTA